MFVENKYKRWYDSLVIKAQKRVIEGYCEKHHIIPKSMGGGNRRDNIVSLTAREHFIAHVLLTKCTSGKAKFSMMNALQKMMYSENAHQHRYINSVMFESLKNQISKAKSDWMKENNPYRGKKHSDEARKTMSEKRKQRHKDGFVEGMQGKYHSEDTKSKLREANKKQFEDPYQKEIRRQINKEAYKDPQRLKACGNGVRGKKWFHNEKECILIQPNNVPSGFVEGRKFFRKGAR